MMPPPRRRNDAAELAALRPSPCCRALERAARGKDVDSGGEVAMMPPPRRRNDAAELAALRPCPVLPSPRARFKAKTLIAEERSL